MIVLDWMPSVWDFFFALESGAWAAIAAWVAVLVGVVTIAITGVYANQQVRQARKQLQDADDARLAQARSEEQARADREQLRLQQAEQAEAARMQQAEDAQALRELQARPNVVMFQEPMEGDWQFLEIVLKNFGKTPAFDIEVQLDTLPEVSPDHPGASTTKVPIPEVIPILAPQQEWRALWDHAPTRFETAPELSSRHEGKVVYRDIDGKNTYETRTVLDFNLLKNTRRVDQKTIHDVAKTLDNRLEKATEHLAKVSQTLHSFTADEHKGVWVYAGDPESERQYRAEENEQRSRRSKRNKEEIDRVFRRATEE
jgi:cell division protein FtsL